MLGFSINRTTEDGVLINRVSVCDTALLLITLRSILALESLTWRVRGAGGPPLCSRTAFLSSPLLSPPSSLTHNDGKSIKEMKGEQEDGRENDGACLKKESNETKKQK